MASSSESQALAASKNKKMRSPVYPGIPLAAAIDRARMFYLHERRNAANVSVALRHWRLNEKSSTGSITIAALLAFGLMIDSGSGAQRKLQLSELGLRLILDQRQSSPERDALIKEAALKPKMHALLWNRWKADLPSDENLRHALIWDWKFNENAVDTFIRQYKATIHFAKLTSTDKLDGLEPEGNREDTDDDAQPVCVGDYVQWTSGGVWQFQEPRRVRKLSEDGVWAFVEGSDTGVPLEELTVEAKGDSPGENAQKPREEEKRREPPLDIEQRRLLKQELVVSIPRKFRVDINVLGDELKREDLAKIKNQFNRWIEGLEEAFD